MKGICGMTDTHSTDEHGNPAGGTFYSMGVQINWQNGPLAEKERNGAFVEDVLIAVRSRLEFYQRSQFSCDENAKAIAAINDALAALNARTARRESAGIEGTHQPDPKEVP